LHDLLPVVDDTSSSRRGTELAAFWKRSGAVRQRQAAVEATARRFQVLLYMVSAAVAHHAVRLAYDCGSCPALRQRAEFEHVIAENSTRLINCPPSETDSRLRQVLGELSGDRRGTRLCGAG